MISPQCGGDLIPSLLPDTSGAHGLQCHDQLREWDLRRVGDQQVSMVLVGFKSIDDHFLAFADLVEGVPDQLCDSAGEDLPAIFRGQHDMGMEVIDHMPTTTPVMPV